VLLAHLTTDAIVLGTAGGLVVMTLAVGRSRERERPEGKPEEKTPVGPGWPRVSPRPPRRRVLAPSFCSMALEIAASRLLAPHLGVSLYSWTGIIGVVLAGVMFGNWAGGRIADQSPKADTLGTCLFLAGLFTLMTLILVALLSRTWDAE